MAFTFTDENVREQIATGQPVVIDFWGTGCGPCEAMAPVVDALAKEYEGKVLIGKYNTTEEWEFCAENHVMGLPTFLFFKNGAITPIRIVGSVKESVLRDKIEELLAL